MATTVAFRTEWDHWCENKFDIIDKKFKSLPEMTLMSMCWFLIRIN